MSDEIENSEPIEDELAGETTEEAAEEAATPDKAKKKKGKSRIIILSVVIVFVLLAGGFGIIYATQHANPEFCNAICHVPMDPYVKSFMEGTSVNAQQTDLQHPLGVVVHRDSDQGIVCLTCHDDGIDAQIQEGLSWLTGNYTLPLQLTITVREPNQPHQRNGITFCLREGCHEGISSLDDLKESTADQTRNPHESHNGDMNCSVCHQMHQQSVSFCTQCHADALVPDGWMTFSEQQRQIKEANSAS